MQKLWKICKKCLHLYITKQWVIMRVKPSKCIPALPSLLFPPLKYYLINWCLYLWLSWTQDFDCRGYRGEVGYRTNVDRSSDACLSAPLCPTGSGYRAEERGRVVAAWFHVVKVSEQKDRMNGCWGGASGSVSEGQRPEPPAVSLNVWKEEGRKPPILVGGKDTGPPILERTYK